MNYREIMMDTLCPRPRDSVTDAMLESLVKCAIDITHENGTPEGTLEAYMSTVVQFLDGWDAASARFQKP